MATYFMATYLWQHIYGTIFDGNIFDGNIFMATYLWQHIPCSGSGLLLGRIVNYQVMSYILAETCSSVVNLRKYNTENLPYSVLILDKYIPNIFNIVNIREQMLDKYTLKRAAEI
jgi:hypothetical protein